MQSLKEYKNKQLLDFIANRVVPCEQRSEDWHNLRKNSFGGSELSSLMGQCNDKYKKAEKRVFGKEKHFEPNVQIIMDWGTVFEPVHRMVMEDLFQDPIIETSLAQGQSFMQGCHQSPDGLATINTELFNKHVRIPDNWQDQEVFKQEYINVLFEQKSPAVRVPNGEMPKKYVGQVKVGLSIFDVCDVGCYTESIFQLCTFEQMFNKSQNNSIIIKRRAKISHLDPLYIGVIVFDEQWIKQYPALMDFGYGDISKYINQNLFIMIAEGVKSGKARNQIICVKFNKNCQKNILSQIPPNSIYVCWKLIYLDMLAVEKSMGFSIFTGMFVNLGQMGISDCLSQNCNKSQKFELLQQLGNYGVKSNSPLSAENLQDKWLKDHKYSLEKFCLENMLECEQKYVVLASLILFDFQKQDSPKLSEYFGKISFCQQKVLEQIFNIQQKNELTMDNDQIPVETNQIQITADKNSSLSQDSITSIVQTQVPHNVSGC